jgi:hypothetical protein
MSPYLVCIKDSLKAVGEDRISDGDIDGFVEKVVNMFGAGFY